MLFAFLLGASTVVLSDPVERVRAYTRQIEFNYISWTINALWSKWQQMAIGSERFVPEAEHSAIVLSYLDLVEQIRTLENEVARIYADPEVADPDTETLELRNQIAGLQIQREDLAPLAETVFQAQLSEVLTDMGISLVGQPVPPVFYHVTAPPNALIVSPRTEIRQDANISIDPEMNLEDITNLEQHVADDLDVSTLIVGIGGVGLYPTMVMQTTDLNWLAEVVAHEWVHNYLTLRPLGVSYLNSPELRIMNETTASIAGKEIGREIIARYYPDKLPPPPNPISQDEISKPNDDSPKFDYRAEMHETRLQVDELLANEEVEAAEDYMELRRRFMWDNGYRIRKLNQAYFAFYGAYADQPGGPAGEDPVGEAVRRLRANSDTLAGFLNSVSWMWTYRQLQQNLERAALPSNRN